MIELNYGARAMHKMMLRTIAFLISYVPPGYIVAGQRKQKTWRGCHDAQRNVQRPPFLLHTFVDLPCLGGSLQSLIYRKAYLPEYRQCYGHASDSVWSRNERRFVQTREPERKRRERPRIDRGFLCG